MALSRLLSSASCKSVLRLWLTDLEVRPTAEPKKRTTKNTAFFVVLLEYL